MKRLSRLSVRLLVALVFVAPSVASAQIEPGRVPLQTALTELARFRERYAEMYNTKDVAELAVMYGDHAIVIANDGSMTVGKAAITAGLKAGAPSFTHVVITSDSMTVYGNTAVDHGTAKFHSAGKPELVERYLVVLRRGMKEWKVVSLANVPVLPAK
ncbi:MAG: nuclear transport factor 2 family protein [Gemmatimonadota bacterium]